MGRQVWGMEMAWNAMDDAPKDQNVLLIARIMINQDANYECVIGCWSKFTDGWKSVPGELDLSPAKWQLLPEIPSEYRKN
jgi:hypothetical protein